MYVLNKAHVELHGREPADAINHYLYDHLILDSILWLCVCVRGVIVGP